MASREQRDFSGTLNSEGGAAIQGDQAAGRDVVISMFRVSSEGKFSTLTVGTNFEDNFTSVRPFARSLYRSCTDASPYFQQLETEMTALLSALETTEECSRDFQFDADHHPQLRGVAQDLHQVLQDLRNLKTHFDEVGTQTQRTWERFNWREDELSGIRIRLEQQKGFLQGININIIKYVGRTLVANIYLAAHVFMRRSSQARIERMLKQYLDEKSAGQRERSTTTFYTADSLPWDEKEAWRQTRKELESLGITPALFTQHREFIVTTLRPIIAEDGLEDDVREPSDNDPFSNEEDIGEPMREAQGPNLDTDSKPSWRFIRSPDALGFSPGATDTELELFYAAEHGHVIVTEQLLDLGVSTCSANKAGYTALHMAAGNGHEAVVQRLLKAGVRIDVPTCFSGSTPLMFAAQRGREGVVRLLLEAGAGIDRCSSRSGQTAIMLAAGNGHKAVVRLLLEAGARSRSPYP